jgi:drug/metabolite transporter (DMT)-like permease
LTRPPQFGAYLALAAVCVFWGTTYLAIRMALETFPPPLLVGARFTLSGTILLIAARIAGLKLPSRRDILYSAGSGLIALGIGNSCLTYAELLIPSSLAALLVTTSPFWMVGMEALTPGGERLHLSTALGMLIGLSGTAMLVGPNALEVGFSGNIMKGFILLQTGCVGWGIGSLAQRRHVSHVNAVVNGGIQQLAAGMGFLIPALLAGKLPTEWTSRGVGAILYLVVFGSIVGYTSYVYALKKLPVAIVTLHTYVNPLVAAALGWFFYREPFGRRETLAMVIIFIGVAVVKQFGGKAERVESPLRTAGIEED